MNCSTLQVFDNTSIRTYVCDGCGRKNETVLHCNVVVTKPHGYDFWLCKECRRQCAMTAQPGDGARPIPDGRQMVTKIRELASGGVPSMSNDQVDRARSDTVERFVAHSEVEHSG